MTMLPPILSMTTHKRNTYNQRMKFEARRPQPAPGMSRMKSLTD